MCGIVSGGWVVFVKYLRWGWSGIDAATTGTRRVTPGHLTFLSLKLPQPVIIPVGLAIQLGRIIHAQCIISFI